MALFYLSSIYWALTYPIQPWGVVFIQPSAQRPVFPCVWGGHLHLDQLAMKPLHVCFLMALQGHRDSAGLLWVFSAQDIPWPSLLSNPTMAVDTSLRMLFPKSCWEENTVSIFRTTNIYLELLSLPLHSNSLQGWEREYRISFSGIYPDLNLPLLVANVLSLSGLVMPRAKGLQVPQPYSLVFMEKNRPGN